MVSNNTFVPEVTFAMSWKQLRKHKLTVFMLCSFTFCFFFGVIFLLPIIEVHASVASIYNLPKVYLFKVNKINTEKGCEICSKLTIKISKRRHWRSSDFFIVNFETIVHLFLVFPILTLNR